LRKIRESPDNQDLAVPEQGRSVHLTPSSERPGQRKLICSRVENLSI
jgi:hypothetical protein